MKDHRSILHASMQTQTVPAEGTAGSSRADSVGRVAAGIAILALAFGSTLGIEAATASGHSGSDHASASQAANSALMRPQMGSHRPWMY